MASHPLDHLNDSRAWEVILVTTLSLCSFSISSCIFFLLHHRSSLFWANREFSCFSVAKDLLRVELELRIMISRLSLANLIV